MEIFTKDFSQTVSNMEMESTKTKMGKFIKENLEIKKNAGTGSKQISREPHIKVILKMD